MHGANGQTGTQDPFILPKCDLTRIDLTRDASLEGTSYLRMGMPVPVGIPSPAGAPFCAVTSDKGLSHVSRFISMPDMVGMSTFPTKRYFMGSTSNSESSI